jgi:hypothetical protein
MPIRNKAIEVERNAVNMPGQDGFHSGRQGFDGYDGQGRGTLCRS